MEQLLEYLLDRAHLYYYHMYHTCDYDKAEKLALEIEEVKQEIIKLKLAI